MYMIISLVHISRRLVFFGAGFNGLRSPLLNAHGYLGDTAVWGHV